MSLSDRKNDSRKAHKGKISLFDASETAQMLAQSKKKEVEIRQAEVQSKMEVDKVTVEKLKSDTKKSIA